MNEQMIKISASLDCANYLDLLSDIRKLEKGGVNMLHLDIMDGHFVPNYALGTNLLRKLRPQTKLLFDVHFMTSNPEVSIPILPTWVRISLLFMLKPHLVFIRWSVL